MKHLFISMAILLTIYSQAQTGDTLFVREPTTPIIINRNNNIYFDLRIKANTASQTLQNLELSLSDLKYVKSVVLYYTGTQNMSKDSDFDKPSYAIKKLEITSVTPTMKMIVDQKLFPDNNFFWIGLTMDDATPLTHKVSMSIKKCTIANKPITISYTGNKTQRRMAISVRNAGDDGVDSYRIPGLVTSKKGTLLAVYDIRRNNSGDLQEDVQVGISRSFDKGQTWQPMQVAIDMRGIGGLPDAQNGVGDPAILVDKVTGDIYIMALWTHGMGGQRAWWGSRKQAITPEQQAAQVVVARSTDDGQTWSKPLNITPQIKDPSWGILLQGPGMGISMEDGTLVFAFQYVDKDNMPHATIAYSKDAGESWELGTAARSNTTEAQVAEIAPGKLMLNMRDNRGGSRAVMTTEDMGKTWVEHSTSRSALIEPVCMASFIRVDDKTLLFSNPAHPKSRTNMTIKASTDSAQSWNNGILIDNGGLWGYSCLTMIDLNNVGILYEGSGAHMTFQVIPLSEITK